jgi:NAD-dependent deacetylase
VEGRVATGGVAALAELVEVHGSIASSSCLACGARFALEEVVARLPGVPACDCGRPLKPDVVTLRRGGTVAIVTKGRTPYDGRAAVKLAGDVERELQALVAAL